MLNIFLLYFHITRVYLNFVDFCGPTKSFWHQNLFFQKELPNKTVSTKYTNWINKRISIKHILGPRFCYTKIFFTSSWSQLSLGQPYFLYFWGHILISTYFYHRKWSQHKWKDQIYCRYTIQHQAYACRHITFSIDVAVSWWLGADWQQK